MKKDKYTEKLIKDVYTNKLQVSPSRRLDERVLANSMDALEKVKNEKPANIQPNIWVVTVRSRIAQVAAMIIVVSAICLVALNYKGEHAKNETAGPEIALGTKAPAKPLSLISLNMTLRYGEIEDVEKQLDMAGKRTKLQRLTIDQLICELDGC